MRNGPTGGISNIVICCRGACNPERKASRHVPLHPPPNAHTHPAATAWAVSPLSARALRGVPASA